MGGAAPPPPFSASSLTRSEISIESCASDEDRNDSNVAYEVFEGSDAGDTVLDDEDTPVKQLEFSSEVDRCRKSGSDEHDSGRRCQESPHPKPGRRPYDGPDDEAGVDSSSSDSDFLPPPAASSIIAHTGHSLEELPLPLRTTRGSKERSEESVGSCLRRLMRGRSSSRNRMSCLM
ncbi:hypothetical protein GGR56DRAFT_616124, partial [Xylariaceae sp. FL0804]